MSYTTPTLGTVTLPRPAGYTEQRSFRGAMSEMANGTVAFDLVQSTAKRLYTLSWTNVSDADKTTIETAFDLLGTATQSFVAPTGGSTTVTRTDGGLEFAFAGAASGELRWSVAMELREI